MAVLVGLVLLVTAVFLTVFEPSDSVPAKLLVIFLWLISASLILFGLQYAIRDTRKRVREISRMIRSRTSQTRQRTNSTSLTAVEGRSFPRWHSDALQALVNTLPSVTGSHHYERAPVRMIVIASNPQQFKAVFLDILYKNLTTESVKGADGVFIVLDGMPRPESVPIVFEAFEAGKPIIVQLVGDVDSISDLQVAAYATAVFHSDVSMVDEIRRRLGHNRIFVGDTGVDTTIVNPVGSQRYHLGSAFHSGQCKQTRSEISRDEKIIVEQLANSNRLTSWDEIGWSSSTECTTALFLNKLFCYAVSISSNKESDTDAGSRLKQLQAMGIPVLSNYTVSIFNQLPWTRIVAERMSLDKLFAQVSRRDSDAMAQIGLQEVILEENFFSAISKQLQQVGLAPAKHRSTHVLVIALGDARKVQEMVDRQTHDHHTTVTPEELKLSELSNYGYIAVMSEKVSYGRNYLRGRLAAFIYTDQLVVTQENGYIGGSYSPGRVHEVATIIPRPDLSLISTEHPNLYSFVSGQADVAQNVYLVDPYQADYAKFVRTENEGKSSKSLKLSVVIPVYNNGNYLIHKAVPSLALNDSFADMEIILVDDGSTDSQTLNICEELTSMYPQIRFFAFNDGGSGSASRPRNYGLDMAKANLVTFLDPDNEISIGGYDRLLSRYEEAKRINPEVEFVSGFQAKVATRRAYTGRHTKSDLEIVSDFRERFFDRGDFPVVSTQAAVISREFFDRTGLRFVESAVGQDTLFGWELLLGAKAGAFVNDTFLLYYAERGDSVTNVVGANYFARVLINEEAKIRVLEQNELLEIYTQTHLPRFIETWYVPRLERVPADEYQTAKRDLEAIVALYDQKLDDYLK